MGKFLHLFLGDSAKTEHDEQYESGYTAPWAAFVENYGMTYNKIERPKTFCTCDYPYDVVDWSQIEEIFFEEMPPLDGPTDFDICDGAYIYYGGKEESWILCAQGESDMECTQVSTVEEINEILNQPTVMELFRQYGPRINGGDYDCPCEYLYVKPMEGYWPPEPTSKSFGSMTSADWTSFYETMDEYGTDMANCQIKTNEVDIFAEFMTGSTQFLDVYVNVPNGDMVLITWNGSYYEYYDTDYEKRGKPEPSYDENYIYEGIIHFVTNGTGEDAGFDHTVPSGLKQALDDNLEIVWYPLDIISEIGGN